jgi:NAD(P)-dependent dehydrogenase (short-subunit alcohol dehydrogenase family)
MTVTPDSASLAGKVVVVTGAAQGIGKAGALACASFGADLAVCDRQEDKLRGVAKEIEGMGRRVVTGFFDVRDPDAVTSHLEDVKDEFGRVDVLVNNAGGTFVSKFMDVNARGQQALIDENYSQVVNFIRGCYPLFPESGGSIVNITSIEALRAAPGFAIYSSMKAAVMQLTQSLALEFGDRHIRVNAIAADAILTEGDQELGSQVGGLAEGYETPIGRYGEPDDMAGPIVFLASDMSRFITGTTLHVGGGTDAASGWRRDGKGGWRP